jgi:hypothetical protein
MGLKPANHEFLAKEKDPVISGYKTNFEARKDAYKAVLHQLKREYILR